ncbi:thioredoxin domain-containing protein [Chloroflexota bacterium]
MRPSVRRLEEQYAGLIDFHILNVDHLSTRDLAFKYNVSAIPNIVLLDAAGNQVQQVMGFQSEEELRASLERLLAGAE